MVDGELDSATVVTGKIIYETQKDGTTIRKKVWVPLEPSIPSNPSNSTSKNVEISDENYEPNDMESPQPEIRTMYQVKRRRLNNFTGFTD